MKDKRWLHWLALVIVAAFAVSSCGGSDDSDSGSDADDGMADDGDMADDGMADDGDMADDGMAAGEMVVMGRADWATGYFQAQIYMQLLEELGYSVSEPADKELGPSLAYLAMANGEMDFWANSWYPLHLTWLAAELPDGSNVRDHVTVVGNEMLSGGLQGVLITKSFADEHGITHIDQINDDPDILQAFDAVDAEPGNGKADIFGCPETWTCDDILDSQIAFSGWDNIVQVKAGYDAMFADAVAKVQAGEPTAIYTWTPTDYILQLRPGDNVVWLAVEDVIDDSNPLGVEGGEEHDQRPGTANLSEEDCPAVVETGVCQLGFVAAHIQVTANSEWLQANPMAAGLFCAVRLSVVEVALANLEQRNAGDESEKFTAELASRWIAENRDKVDGWLDEARSAPMPPSCPETENPIS